jgi:oxygen-independent coproporphyrinogen-3 oxidase
MQPPPLGLYIHLPWCERKCPYCDFNSHEAEVVPQQEYIDALLRDLDRDLPLVQDRPVETLFVGGGTPSLFEPEAIARLLAGVNTRLQLDPDLEATLEANPGSAEAAKFLGFRQAGINRLSIGVQSFNDDCLQRLGRVHDSEQAETAIALARAAGLDSFNIDLMHGLPDQGTPDARADLHKAMSLGAPHLSWYQLTLEPNTRFFSQPPLLPDEDGLAAIQEEGEQILQGAGYVQYEVSAWSRPGFQCRHNRNYWTFGDYLGIGAGAHGKITGTDGRIMRYRKTRTPRSYLQAEHDFRADSKALGQDDIVGEFMLNVLRLHEGFTADLFETRTGLPARLIVERIHSLGERQLLEQAGTTIRATPLGRRFLDTVVAEFFPD